MTDNEIIKAKENKELRAEVEKLELLNAILLESCNGYSKACDTYKAEIERLESEMDKQYEIAEANVRAEIASGGTSCHWCEDNARGEAIKEFADRLKAIYGEWLYDHRIDDLVKEMVGDSDEN